AETRDAMARRIAAAVAAPGCFAARPDDLRRIGEAELASRQSFDGYRRQLFAALAHSAAARLRRLAAPTLVVHGALDRVIPPVNGWRLWRLIPNVRVITLPNVG